MSKRGADGENEGIRGEKFMETDQISEYNQRAPAAQLAKRQ